ncbi:hypothetical protein [Bacillus sp. Marseille-P3661]|uniref:hypothetical protein n=1 Tax=Bacillus sp. Marseille-P3661 TaxID=1936234 RepID=UPI000C858A87|nr:hypothetical protein [Bacillus sp. Marseille-P3661]
MKKISALIFTISICVYSILHFINLGYPFALSSFLLSLIGFISLLSGLITLHIKKMAIPLFLVIAMLTITFATDLPLIESILEGTTEMSGLISLLLIVPMISWTLRDEPYIESVMSCARNILNTSQKFYFGMLAITQIITYFLLFGSIPMVYQLVNDFLSGKKGEAWDNYRSTALLRGFALTTMWVISMPSFVFAVDHLGASLGISILQGFIISLCGILLASLFLRFQEKRYGIDLTSGIKEEIRRIVDNSTSIKDANKKALQFGLLFISLFGSIIIIHSTLKWELLVVIPPVIVVWTFVYFLVKRKSTKFLHHCKQYMFKDMQGQAQQFSIMLSAGMFIYAVNQSGLGHTLVDLIFFIADSIPFINVLWIIPIVVILLGYLGLGPLVVIVLVAGILEHVSLPYPPELVVLSITSGSVLSVLLSPFILPVIVLSAANGLSLFKNGLRFNFGYAIVFYIIVQTYLQIMIHLKV